MIIICKLGNNTRIIPDVEKVKVVEDKIYFRKKSDSLTRSLPKNIEFYIVEDKSPEVREEVK